MIDIFKSNGKYLLNLTLFQPTFEFQPMLDTVIRKKRVVDWQNWLKVESPKLSFLCQFDFYPSGTYENSFLFICDTKLPFKQELSVRLCSVGYRKISVVFGDSFSDEFYLENEEF